MYRKHHPHPHLEDKRNARQQGGQHDLLHCQKKPRTSKSHLVSPASITCFQDLKNLELGKPTRVENVIAHVLKVMSEEYRLLGKLTAYTDSNGNSCPLDHWNEIIRRTNFTLKTCVNGKMIIKTYYADDTSEPTKPPKGMHIFAPPREITQDLIQDALHDAREIYWNPVHRANKDIHITKNTPSPACNMLFYTGCPHREPNIKNVFKILFTHAPALATYALIYVRMMMDILRLDIEEMESIYMALNHYDPDAAINPHIDTVYPFKGKLGPIFTVAMGQSEKMIDLLPVLLPDSHQPMRIFSKPNELMLMDGEVRTLWAHSKPWNYPHEQFTIVFKCPEFQTKTHETEIEYEGHKLTIPYHYVSPFEQLKDDHNHTTEKSS